MSYQTSSVIITGASQGIGRSISISFAAQTSRPLLLLARNAKNLEKTAELCREAGSKQVALLVCDATSPSDLRQLVLPKRFPEPGIIVNNAGSYLYKKLEDTTNDEFQNQIDINLFTAVNVVQRFLPALKTLDRALIVNICSVASLKGYGDSGAYSAAKHAVLGYTRSLREELIESNIGVTAINLGQTHSTSWAESDMSPAKLIDPIDVANLIVAISKMSPQSVVEEISIQPQHGRVSPY